MVTVLCGSLVVALAAP
nr:hypothetical protein [Vibrio cholerae]